MLMMAGSGNLVADMDTAGMGLTVAVETETNGFVTLVVKGLTGIMSLVLSAV